MMCWVVGEAVEVPGLSLSIVSFTSLYGIPDAEVLPEEEPLCGC